MMLSIDGDEKLPEQVTYWEKGFGKPLDSPSCNYVLHISKAEFLDRLSAIYDECIIELKYDDELTGKFEPPYPGAETYPSLERFLDIGGESLFDFIYTFLKFNVLSQYFIEGNSHGKALYSLDTLQTVIVEGGEVVLTGIAHSISSR